ncbi:endoplasmic reticulum protein [Cryptococcus neoformans]|nr:endoplasmic reticulum protein [Cryptococcus neoformans var. grubii Bt120]OXG48770.1 endoplasmic reticulum protein [Cryptococcus neoformans var. grubii Th84]OXH08371.1 endoplasmic reticulum protein [Cryptococcus neoformans var. grubii]OXH29380.1 endoplasmic reticulum protein [Cryptococcus neoformans var. grubii]OXH49292.1 endoplasmic reticulum protein [Cryptococcus neoformans var. grubii]
MRSRARTSQSGKTLRNYSCEENGSDVNDVPQANDTPDAKAAPALRMLSLKGASQN